MNNIKLSLILEFSKGTKRISFGSSVFLLLVCHNWLREKCVKLRVVFIRVTRCFSLGDWVWGRFRLLKQLPLDQSSDDDAAISDYLHPSQSLLNVENWFSES